MIKFEKDFSEIKESNLVFLIEAKSDLDLLKFLKLDKKILDKINKIIKKKENATLDFFIWTPSFEKLFLIYFNWEKDINYFLWDEFRELPWKLTILPNSNKNVEILLNNILLARYKYEEYKTEKKPDNIYFIVHWEQEKIAKQRLKTIENIILARNLATMPANDLNPENFANIVKKTKFKSTKVRVFDFKDIKRLWLGLLEAVWKWSANKPYMVILEKIVNRKFLTIWLVWKWITFDTGWIQVKPDTSMYEMKWDMSGSADVFAIMKEFDNKKLNVNIVACLVLAENHIWWESYKPSDIFKSYSWKTVDISHTDAEWRLILADWISYISKNYKLEKVVSIATLTGACMHALGFRYAWIMWNDDDFIGKVLDYSKNNFEKYCRLPFDDYFVEKTKWEITDLANSSGKKVYAGSSMWWAFLYNFLMNNEKYTHIDVAWTAINWSEAYGYANSWMTGFGVDSLSKVIENL